MWQRVTAASAFSVTLAEAKAQCRIDGDDENALLNGLIAAADDVVGNMVGFPLGVENWAATIVGEGRIEVPLYPVTKLKAVGDDLEGFALVREGEKAFIAGPWPAEAVEVSVEVGGFVPPAIKLAQLLLIGHWYEQREAVSDKPLKEVPFAVESMVNLYRRGWAAA